MVFWILICYSEAHCHNTGHLNIEQAKVFYSDKFVIQIYTTIPNKPITILEYCQTLSVPSKSITQILYITRWGVCTDWYRPDILWGFQILTNLDSKWSKRGWVGYGLDFDRDLKYGSPTIWNLEALPVDIQTNGRHFVNTHLKSGPKCQDFKCCGFQLVGTTIADLLKSSLEKFRRWNVKTLTLFCTNK